MAAYMGRKWRNRLLCMAVVVCMFAVCFLTMQSAKSADRYVAELTINAYAKHLASETHAYLTIKNTTLSTTLDFLSYPLKGGDTMSVSIFGDASFLSGLGGVYINMELCKPTDLPVASFTIPITKSQFDLIAAKTPAESYYHDGTADNGLDADNFWHNCTTYTVKMWNMVAPERYHIPSDIFGIDAPKWVRDEIRKWPGHTYAAIELPRSYRLSEGFYVSKDEEFVPCDAPKPQISAMVINDGSVELTWSSAVVRLLNGKRNINCYYIEMKDETTKVTKSVLTSNLQRSVEITDLTPNHTYSFQVCGAHASDLGSFRAVTMSDRVTVNIGQRLFIDRTDMGMNLQAVFTKEWAGATGDLAYAYWCQDRIYGTNGTDANSFGHASVNTLFAGSDQPNTFMVITPGVHIRTRGVGSIPPRSYIVADHDNVSIDVTYVDEGGNIRLTYYPWRMFYQFLNQQGGTAYVQYWNATGASDPKGSAAVSANAGRLHVSGWAMDASAASQALTIRVYVGNETASFITDQRRADLPYDGNHGFDKTVLTGLSGSQRVRVVAVNVGAGNDTVLYDGYVQIPSAQTMAESMMHIDAPSGSYAADNNIEVSFWVASNKRVTGASYQVGGVENSVGFAHEQAVLDAQPDYAYGYRCRGVIDVSRRSPGSSYTITMRVYYEDGTSSQINGSFSVAAAPVVKKPILHIDHPTGTYSGFQDMEFSGWIVSDEAISYGFYEITSTDGTVAFQGGVNIADDRDVQNSYPSYRYAKRMRGVISLGSLRANKNYTCKMAVTLVNGETHTAVHNFSVGKIYEYDTRHIVHVDSPANGRVYSGANNIEVSSWVVANAPITYCIYEVRRVSDGAYLGQWSLEAQSSAPDLDAAYPNYAYRRRFRGVIEIAGLESNTDYEFRIWYGIGSKGIQSSLGTARFSTGNISCEEYLVSYDVNGGSGVISAQTKKQHQNLTLSGVVPVRTGYQFLGWAKSPNASEPEYFPMDVYGLDEDLKLYAVWKNAQLIPSELLAKSFGVNVPFGGSDAWFAFIPQEDGHYSFTSSGAAKDVVLTILDEAGGEVISTSGDGHSFTLEASLEAGQKYFLRAGFTSGEHSGSYSLTMRRCYRVTYMTGGMESLLLNTYYKEHGKNFTITTTAPVAARKITLLPNGGTLADTELLFSDRFRSWNTKTDGTGTAYQLGDVYTANKQLILYPVWEGAVVTKLPVPARDNDRFEGWYLHTQSGQQKVSVGDVIRTDVSLVAHWKAETLNICFDPNGGTGTISPIAVKSGESMIIPSAQPERFGYEFLGWAADPAAKWPNYYAAKSYVPESSMTLYAVWDAPDVIPSDAREETFTIGLDTSTETEYYAFAPDADTRFKFRAAGEPDQKDIAVFTADGDELDCAAEMVDGSKVYKEYDLYAGQNYIIRVICKGSTGDLASLMMFRGYAVTQMYYGLNMAIVYCYEGQTDFSLLPAISREVKLSFDPRGGSMSATSKTYKIHQVAWSTEKNGKGVWYGPGTTRVFTEPVTLYAVYDRTPSDDMEIPVREGYRFEGWYTNAYGTVLGGTLISSDSLANYLLYSGQSLFARWTEISQNEVTFGGNGGTGNVSSITVPVGGNFTVPDEIPTRFGYRFLGWSTDPAAQLPSYYPGDTYAATSELSLYAVWKAPTLVPADAAREIYSIDLGTSNQLDTYFIFSPETSGRYMLRAAGEPDEKELAVYDANENPVACLSTRMDGSKIYKEYQLDGNKSYIIQLSCAGEEGDLASLIISRGYLVHFVNSDSSVETRVCFEKQEDFVLPTCASLKAKVTFDPQGGSMAQTSRVYSIAHVKWNTAPDGSGTNYSPGSTQAFNAPTVLYALYENKTLGQLENPVRSGWRFDGWMTADGKTVGKDTPIASIGLDGTVLYAGWTELASIHLKGIETPAKNAVLPMDRDAAVAGWVVSQEKITDVVFVLADAKGQVIWQSEAQRDAAAEDLDQAYGSYAFRTRVRSTIPVSVLKPASGYTLSMRVELGDANAETFPVSYALTTGDSAQIPSGAASHTISIPFSKDESSSRYAFTPAASGRYMFRLSGEMKDMEISLHDGAKQIVPVESTSSGSTVVSVYVLRENTAYTVTLQAKAVKQQFMELGVHRGYEISYQSAFGTAEATYCYAGLGKTALALERTERVTITLDPVGGSLKQTSLTYTRRIEEWNTRADGKGTGYAPGSLQSFAQNTVLYGIPSQPAIGEMETPVRSGYSFAGWYTAAEGGSLVTEETLVSDLLNGERKLYAHWADLSRTITIRFDTSSGTGYPDPVEIPYGAGFVIPSQIPTMDECRFEGWYTEKYGRGTLVTDGMVFTEDTTLYPKWIVVSWRAAPEVQEPSVNGRTVTLRWNVYEQAQEYEIWEIEGNMMRWVTAVDGLTANISRVLPGSHIYRVIPRQQESGSWHFGSESNMVTAEVGHAVMYVPKQLKTIEESAFENNLQFTMIILGDQVERIGDYAFLNCRDLMSIYLPPGVKEIGTDAFKGCKKLVVTCHAGSAAETYCIAHSIEYILADE